jgi:hypothetical protein
MVEYRGTKIPSTSYQLYNGFQHQGGIHEDSISVASAFKTPTHEMQDYTASFGPVPSENASARKLSFDYSQSLLKSSQPAASRQKRWRLLAWAVKYGLVIALVAVILAIPIIVFRTDQEIDSDESPASKQYKNLIFYLFIWLEITWLSGCAADMFILAFPFLYRTVAR